jgi:hypothetical protein
MTLDLYASLFDEARHAAETRERMAAQSLRVAARTVARRCGPGAGNVVALRVGVVDSVG